MLWWWGGGSRVGTFLPEQRECRRRGKIPMSREGTRLQLLMRSSGLAGGGLG